MFSFLSVLFSALVLSLLAERSEGSYFRYRETHHSDGVKCINLESQLGLRCCTDLMLVLFLPLPALRSQWPILLAIMKLSFPEGHDVLLTHTWRKSGTLDCLLFIFVYDWQGNYL